MNEIFIFLIAYISSILCFNLDVNAPIYKYGPPNTYFGYSVAQHFIKEQPVILIGAPRAESGQKDTNRTGAVYSCGLNTAYTNSRKNEWCQMVLGEYESGSVGYTKRPDETAVFGKDVHYLGKNDQLLGASLSSLGTPNGGAVMCAPLIRMNNNTASAQGACYELESDLSLKQFYSTCVQRNLPRQDRHNDYGACMEGISVKMTPNNLITGLIGAKKWTGGVYAKYSKGGLFGQSEEKYTMMQQEGGIREMLTSHDYLGYSVAIGRFGFWHEDESSQTIVSGATRSGQHGAVIFLPMNLKEHNNRLSFTDDRFVLNGTKMGSAFGYSVEVLDINNDGFDDLVVGAPFEHRSDGDGQFGGIVYVYFSQGVKRSKGESDKVFHPPVVLKGPAYFSQFGLSITKLGNLDGDKNGANDFAIGAPYSNDGKGAVYIYLGSKDPKKFRRKPAQVISGGDLPNLADKSMKSFGFSLAGGVDMDGNGYPDLVVGSVARDVVTILRSRPVISMSSSHKTASKFIDIEKGQNCPRGAKTCFPLDLSIIVDGETSKGADLVNLNGDVFFCNLEVVQFSQGVAPRALIGDNNSVNYTWPCGADSNNKKQTYTRVIYIPSNEQSKDWINPLKFKFTVKLRDDKKPSMPSEGAKLVDLKQYPILNRYGATYDFSIGFETRCGEDHLCQTDLAMDATFVGIPRTEKGYVMNVGDKDHLDIAFTVENKKERAYQAALYLSFDPEELELPTVVGNSRLTAETVGKKNVIVRLGNPMNDNAKYQFEVRFKLVRGRTEGIGRPLAFKAIVNSTSQETNDGDNSWEAHVQVIKAAELEMIGASDPKTVRYGGDIKGESSMDLEEDIGPMVSHIYTLHNKGPWTVRNVQAEFDWPYQIGSAHQQGKWALYLLDVPTATTFNTDGTSHTKKCTVERQWEHVNALDHIKLNTIYTRLEDTKPEVRRRKRSEPETAEAKIMAAKFSRNRIQPKPREEHGVEVNVVTISCADATAKCFKVTCHFDFIDANSQPEIIFRARLWNSTFVEDYYDVEYVEILSSGRIILDSSQGIEDDPSNNMANAVTLAYPDRPSIGETRPIPIWYIIAAVIAGLLILALFIGCLWWCGFFKRKRATQPFLHQAQLNYDKDQWCESKM